MSLETIGALFGAVFAISAGLVGGVVYAIRKTSIGGIETKLAVIETDISWIKGELSRLGTGK